MAAGAMEFFRLPTNRVVELGSQLKSGGVFADGSARPMPGRLTAVLPGR
jgi:hypothetical protein